MSEVNTVLGNNFFDTLLTFYNITGVTTNKSFILNVLRHPDFVDGTVTTKFIEDHPESLVPLPSQDRAQKLLHFLANVIVNGAEDKGVQEGIPSPKFDLKSPQFEPSPNNEKTTLRSVFVNNGPEAFAKAVRAFCGKYPFTWFAGYTVNH